MMCKPGCWAAPSPVLGNLTTSQALLATFWTSAELAEDEWAADPRGIPMVACKRPGTESLDSEGSPGPISFLVSGIHRAGAKGITGWWRGATVVPGPSECCEWGHGTSREGCGVCGKEASIADSDRETGQRWPDLWQTPPKSSSSEAKAQPSTGPGLGLSEDPTDIEPL